MNCPKHPSRKMTQLFSSWVCDECDPPRVSVPAVQANSAMDRRTTIHFGPYTYISGAIWPFTVKPQFTFIGHKFVLLGDSDGLFVHNMTVNGRSQVPADIKLPVPLEWFRPHPLSGGIRLDTCKAGQDITWMIENRASAPRKFHVAILGVRAIK